ncbi:hypothetical protein PN462_17405, partial [Spirulina sp. CS-785/01]|uniref:hypothetical protein n=1 Tax=Spirulina sp. CS-785/01 TaxID=3021716 RepID=UPI0023310AB9
VERDTVVSDTCERHFLPLSQGWERGLGGEGDSKPPYLVTHLDRAGIADPTPINYPINLFYFNPRHILP